MDTVMASSWTTYPKIYALGHGAIQDLFKYPVLIEEKVDGSQISFGVFNGELKVRSKSKDQLVDAPDKMFKEAMVQLQARKAYMPDGVTFRGEYLQSPSHNVLAYDRTPKDNIVLFDVAEGAETYVGYAKKVDYALKLGFEVVPIIYEGMVNSPEELKAFLGRDSFLGGQKVEGVVVKNYTVFGIDGKPLMGKLVSEAYKEVHAGEWKEKNPGQGDILEKIIAKFKTPARWDKAVIHLKEKGQLENSPKDIGPLMTEVLEDIKAEETETIKAMLFKWGWEKVARALVGGLPQWYKDKLLEKQFTKTEQLPNG